MYDIIRDSSFGQVLQYFARNKILLFPDELPNFELPSPTTEEKRIEYQSEVSTISNFGQEASQNEVVDAEKQAQQADNLSITRAASRPIHPVITSEGIVLIDWYSTGMSDACIKSQLNDADL